jgi:AcrR family transcriptional regulator
MNHVMIMAGDDLRTRQLAVTRQRIARAVADIVVSEGAASLSFPAVADRAGVSLRTVYRHFPKKDALVTAALEAGSERTLSAFPSGERSIGRLRELIRELWAELAENRDLVLVQQTTPAGRALRGERLRRRREELRASLPDEVPGLDDDGYDRLAALCTVLFSSHLLFDLTDELGVERDTAAGLAAYALEAACERARREGDVR